MAHKGPLVYCISEQVTQDSLSSQSYPLLVSITQ